MLLTDGLVMKRNEELAVSLLLFLESVDDGSGLARHELKDLLDQSDHASDWSAEQLWNALDYHLRILVTAGFLTETPAAEGMAHDDFDLTWAGHEYLDANRPVELLDLSGIN